MSNTKNLGQVAGLFIGLSAPENTTLIWYDSTPNQQCHKVYDVAKKAWVALNPQIVAQTTYSELVNNAKKNGLAIGKFYQITDKSNTLAIAIASTKVQYVDSIGNLLVDDLGTNIQYHVSSDNLLIDDLGGVWNSTTNKLIFQFSDLTPNNSTDYLLGKARSGNKWVLAKFALSKLLSAVSGNSLTWNGGLFFNFKLAIASILDKEGGIISKEVYDKNLTSMQNAIASVAKENQTIIQNANTAITEGTSDDAIFAKKNTKDIDTATAAGDILKGDTLFTIVSKIQRWINKFKYATGISLSRSFADATKQQYINNNDTVESALGKVQYMLKNPTGSYVLPEGWRWDEEQLDDDGEYIWEPGDLPIAGDSFDRVFRKLSMFLGYAHQFVKLSKNFTPKNYAATVALPAAGDSLEEAFAKAVAKLNQIGNITNGQVTSKAMLSNSSSTPITTLNLANGNLLFNANQSDDSTYQINLTRTGGLVIQSNAQSSLRKLNVSPNGFEFRTNKSSTWSINGSKVVDAEGFNISSGAAFLNSEYTALTAKTAGTYKYGYYDAFFGNIKLGALVLDAVTFATTNVYITANTSLVFCNNSSESINVYLPSSPEAGRVVYVLRVSNGGVNVCVQGNNGIDMKGHSDTTVGVGSRGDILMFIFQGSSIYYKDETRYGLWSYGWLNHN